MSQRVMWIFNPSADKGRAGRRLQLLRRLLPAPDRDWFVTQGAGHATQLAAQAAQQGYDTVAAVGGDGTTHEVVNGLMRIPTAHRPHLALIPFGSGNDFSTNVGLPQAMEQAVERALHGAPRPVDVGLLRDQHGKTTYWNNTLGIGFDAAVVIRSRRIQRLKGFAMYLWAVIQTILRDHHAPPMTIATDQETIARPTLMLVLCNGAREGGGFLVAPAARPDDGVLDLAMIERVSRLMMFRLVPEVMRGTHARFRPVRLGRFRRLELTMEQPLPVHADGEVLYQPQDGVRRLQVEVVPQALRVRA